MTHHEVGVLLHSLMATVDGGKGSASGPGRFILEEKAPR